MRSRRLYGSQRVPASALSIGTAELSATSVTLQSSDAQAFPVPPTISIPAGQYNAAIQVHTGRVTAYTRIEITATLSDSSLHATLELHPPIG